MIGIINQDLAVVRKEPINRTLRDIPGIPDWHINLHYKQNIITIYTGNKKITNLFSS